MPGSPVSHPRLFLLASFAAILFLSHAIFLTVPYFWDELGQFVPAALDIFHDGAWVPHSTIPNVHPPGVMAWLALIWTVTGYSILSTRAAMLVFAALGVLFTFLLAIRLCRGLPGAPAFFALLLLLVDPLFFTQAMLAQLDMPAMVFSLAALLCFLEDRHAAGGLACFALVLCKETGVILPALFVLWLLAGPGGKKQALWYVPSFIALAGWLSILWLKTGTPFGNREFEHYNIGYSLHPVRAAASLARRFYYLFVADFRWIGSIAIVYAWQRGAFRDVAWRRTAAFGAAHGLLVSLLGGAELERYLLPVLPLFYIATGAAWSALPALWRNLSVVALPVALLAGLFVNPPYPFPFENNLAVVDFVELHRTAAAYLERHYAGETVYTAWPLTAALRRPEFGYVERGLQTAETSDLRASTIDALPAGPVHVLVTYSRTWEPEWGVLRFAWVRWFLTRYYEYEAQANSQQILSHLGLRQIIRWTRHGQWIEIFAVSGPS